MNENPCMPRFTQGEEGGSIQEGAVRQRSVGFTADTFRDDTFTVHTDSRRHGSATSGPGGSGGGSSTAKDKRGRPRQKSSLTVNMRDACSQLLTGVAKLGRKTIWAASSVWGAERTESLVCSPQPRIFPSMYVGLILSTGAVLGSGYRNCRVYWETY